MHRIRVLFLVAASVALACGGGAEEAGPEAAEDTTEAAEVSEEVSPEVAERVKATVVERVHAYNDTIPLAHPETGDRVELAFDSVHEEVVATPGGRYRACVDFVGPDDQVWDIDFYVDETDGEYAVEDELIHKIGGENVIPEGARRRLDTQQ
ncbi:MAG: hypothetical protein R3199_07750 [Gemmatimonadota bacterium]|nr:hypothetical protein [Gemmatimonadota bacterium]